MIPRDLLKLAAQVKPSLVLPPGHGPDVCPVCRSWRLKDEERCNNCEQAIAELSIPCADVIPISLYSKPSILRDWLTYYKPNDVEYRPEYAENVAAIFASFLDASRESLYKELNGWDEVTIVPSSTRPPPHPLQAILEALLRPDDLRTDILNRTDVPLGHRVMSDDAFVASGDVAGRRILLIDDVFTTGARSQSAASALSMAGAAVAGILVAARRINPDFNEVADRLWNQQVAVGYEFGWNYWETV